MSGQTKAIIGVLLGTGLLIAGFVVFGSKSLPSKLGTKTEGTTQLTRDYDPAIGAAKDKAKVTMVEFADLECPACAATAPVLRQLVPAEPDMRLEFRHFPLDQHVNAENAAKAAEAANVQGKFWELYDMLYARQNEWSSLTDSEATTKFESYATELGLNLDEFKSDRNNGDLLDHIRLDKGEGLALGVNATPTLFINGTKYEGARDLNSLKKAVEDAAKAAKK